MSEHVLIRKADIDDSSNIAEVHNKSWIETYTGLMPDEVLKNLNYNKRKLMWKKEIAQNDGYVFVATYNKKVIGFISAGKPRDLKGSAEIEIFAFYLLKDYHGQGIGYQLYQKLKTEVNDLRILIWVLKTNPSRKFYERIGGKVISEKTGDVFGSKICEIGYLVD